MRGRPDDWTRAVRGNWRKVTAYLVSSRHPACLKMAKDELAHINHVMEHVPLERIQDLRPPEHWFMAVIVCPGDRLDDLATWAKDQDADRIHFYLHKEADARDLGPWRDADLPLASIETRLTSFGPMHAKLELHLSDQVYGDFAP